MAFVFVTTTIVAIAGVIFAGPLSRALLGVTNPALIDFAMLGVWAFTNLEIAEALLRADERTGTYMRASVANVVMSIILMVYLVVVRHDGARGLLAGNYTASALELLGLWWVERRRLLAPLRARFAGPALPLRAMLAFGLPTVPADASVYALQVVDRWYLLRAQSVGCRRALRARGQARDRRLRRGPRLPVRVAAAGLLGDRRRRRGASCTRWSPPTTCSPPASSSPASRCSGAGRCGCCSTTTTARTSRCRGSRSAGRSTACT